MIENVAKELVTAGLAETGEGGGNGPMVAILMALTYLTQTTIQSQTIKPNTILTDFGGVTVGILTAYPAH